MHKQIRCPQNVKRLMIQARDSTTPTRNIEFVVCNVYQGYLLCFELVNEILLKVQI